MVPAVILGYREDEAEPPRAVSDVAVLEQQVDVEDCQETRHRLGWRANEAGDHQPRRSFDQEVKGMSALAVQGVEPLGPVVDRVEAPQPGHGVAQAVHHVNAEIHYNPCQKRLQ
jgi:hypothetical protein